MYSSSTISATPVNPSQPTGVSLMCMSCHDGVTSLAVNSLQQNPGGASQVFVDTGMMANPGAIGNIYNGGLVGWGPNIGGVVPGGANKNINLSNDHPISFNWNYTKPDLYNGPQNPNLRLFNWQGNSQMLECATCHRVHDPSIPPFLAMSNAQSAMCLACHNK